MLNVSIVHRQDTNSATAFVLLNDRPEKQHFDQKFNRGRTEEYSRTPSVLDPLLFTVDSHSHIPLSGSYIKCTLNASLLTLYVNNLH